jgi:flagellar hook-length control protein FliK
LNAAGSGATSGINTARLIQSMSETEMRVGMHSTEFGDISIRTMVSQQQMQAQISVDHSELSNAISAHIPSIQTKLDNQYGLHASIEVSQGGASFSGERGQSSPKDQRAFTPSVQLEGTAPALEIDRMVLRVPSVAVVSDRLDIRA